MNNKSKNPDTSVSITDIQRAAARLKGIVHRTPLDSSPALTSHIGTETRLKLENLQLTGSFKVRGAVNVLANLSDKQRRQGVIAPTAGNHGLGLSFAGRALNLPVTIYLPRSADPMKIAAMQENGAKIEFFDEIEEARLAAIAASKQQGAVFVSAYDHPDMVAGGGTVGLEIMEDWIDTDVILVCAGGGGLVSGIATAAKAINPAVEVWGVQSEASPTFARWMDAGDTIPVDLSPSIAEGVSGIIEPGTMTWPLVRDRVDRILTVSENEIKTTMLWMLDHHRHVVEPSGVLAVAGALRYAEQLAGRRSVAVVTGRNVSSTRYRNLLDEIAG